mmetsp:Transcript_30576/g.67725  ORF Transcript_30576/g.67725 Transcript_30576/m.67725 type:complete len:452 (-) Transcript_30576:100-1455(-)
MPSRPCHARASAAEHTVSRNRPGYGAAAGRPHQALPLGCWVVVDRVYGAHAVTPPCCQGQCVGVELQATDWAHLVGEEGGLSSDGTDHVALVRPHLDHLRRGARRHERRVRVCDQRRHPPLGVCLYCAYHTAGCPWVPHPPLGCGTAPRGGGGRHTHVQEPQLPLLRSRNHQAWPVVRLKNHSRGGLLEGLEEHGGLPGVAHVKHAHAAVAADCEEGVGVCVAEHDALHVGSGAAQRHGDHIGAHLVLQVPAVHHLGVAAPRSKQVGAGRAPLKGSGVAVSRGQVDGDGLQCGGHALCAGQCVAPPHPHRPITGPCQQHGAIQLIELPHEHHLGGQHAGVIDGGAICDVECVDAGGVCVVEDLNEAPRVRHTQQRVVGVEGEGGQALTASLHAEDLLPQLRRHQALAAPYAGLYLADAVPPAVRVHGSTPGRIRHPLTVTPGTSHGLQHGP